MFFGLFGKKKKKHHDDHIAPDSVDKEVDAIKEIINKITDSNVMKLIGDINFSKSIALSGNIANYLYFKEIVNDTLKKIIYINVLYDALRVNHKDACTRLISGCTPHGLLLMKVKAHDYILSCAFFYEFVNSIKTVDVKNDIERIILSYDRIIKI